ncbi:putative deoxyribonuclease TATDN2 [Hyperolius riggenbachi]|uniref:putative deoxyribonuclease TATDN2 n=1 Tax=Hyperolius riggenbachi TaxID=752182 RepID=UPI0035A278E6
MADRSMYSSRKHKWSSPPEMSPNKYLRGNDSRLPRGAYQSRDDDSESPYQPRERHVTLQPYESTPKRLPKASTGDGSLVRERKGHLRTHSMEYNRSFRLEPAVSETSRHSVSLGEGDVHLEVEDKSEDVSRSRVRRQHNPNMLFKRAFSDIGVSARGRRSLDSQSSPKEEEKHSEKKSLLHGEKFRDSNLPSRWDNPEKEVIEERLSQRKERVQHRKDSPEREVEEQRPWQRKERVQQKDSPEREIKEERSWQRKERVQHRKDSPEREVAEERSWQRKERVQHRKGSPEREIKEERSSQRKERVQHRKNSPEREIEEERSWQRKERVQHRKNSPEREIEEERSWQRKEKVQHRKNSPEREIEEERSWQRKERVQHRKDSPEREIEEERSWQRKERVQHEKDNPERGKKVERSSQRKEKVRHRKVSPKPIRSDPPKPPEEEPTPKENTRLVFYDDSDKEINTGTAMEKDPSIGSDFSDVEDVGTYARFSQEDTPVPASPVEDRRRSSDYMTYPRFLFGSPWNRATDASSTSPLYKPSREQNTWRQNSLNSSFVSVASDNKERSRYLSSDSDDDLNRSQDRTAPFNASWASDRTTRSVRRTFQVLPSDDRDAPKSLGDGFIDTHCHLDMLFARLQHRCSFADLREQFASTFPAEFQGCITDYCDPRTLRRLPWQHILSENMVWGAFGCHPHFAQYYTRELEEEMLQALRHPNAIAFGEMGLDYSHKCSTNIAEQHAVFEKQLKLAVPLGKPLVIHCRGADEDLCKIMKEWVPRDYKIHRHCFTGNYKDIEPLLNEFPNMSVGFTAVLTYPSASEAREAVARIPLDRLIVETDAPFFVPRQVPKSVCKFAHPGLALHTVEEIARIKNLTVRSVLSKVRENTRLLYSI